jgi:hypothetical protein
MCNLKHHPHAGAVVAFFPHVTVQAACRHDARLSSAAAFVVAAAAAIAVMALSSSLTTIAYDSG